MGIEYYAFALFVAALICLIAILFKLLFTNNRQQRKLLDEKETKLLQLYQTVESIMDDFNDQIRTAMDDIKEHEERAAAHMAKTARRPEPIITEETEPQPQVERQSRAMTVDSSIIRAAGEALERAERMVKNDAHKDVHKDVHPYAHKDAYKAAATIPHSGNGAIVQRLFDDGSAERQESAAETQNVNKKRESILALADEGKTQAQIAQELGITQNEVKLVIDLGVRA